MYPGHARVKAPVFREEVTQARATPWTVPEARRVHQIDQNVQINSSESTLEQRHIRYIDPARLDSATQFSIVGANDNGQPSLACQMHCVTQPVTTVHCAPQFEAGPAAVTCSRMYSTMRMHLLWPTGYPGSCVRSRPMLAGPSLLNQVQIRARRTSSRSARAS
jgi:hypothetical protein